MKPHMFLALVELGLTTTQIAGVLKIFDLDAVERRALAAARVQRHRDRKKAEVECNVTVTPVTLRNASRAPAPGEDNLLSKEITEQKERKRERSPNGSRLPADFVPTPGVAKDAGLTREEFETQFALFKDHWTAKAGKDARKADWQATWRNWCRRAVEYRKGRAREPTYAEQSMEDFKNIWENGHGTEEKRLGNSGRRNVVRLLPRQGGEPDRND